jgi:TonB family protein
MRSRYALSLVVVTMSIIFFRPAILDAQGTGANTGQSRPMRIKVSGDAEAAQIINRVEPNYPDEARRQQIEGQVVLHVIVGVDGAVKDLTVISGPQQLTQSALEAVKKWRYRPSLLNGNPLEVDTTITVNFSLQNGTVKSTGPSASTSPPPDVHGSSGQGTLQGQEPPCSNPSKSYPEAMCLEDLANVYEGQGKYADAELILKRALAVREKAHGPDDPDVAWGAQRLAYSYMQEGKYSDAEPYLKRAIAVREKALGPESREVSESVRLLARAYFDQGRYADAEPLDARSLAILEKVLPPGSPGYPDVAESMDDLGLDYMYESKFAQAEPLFERALEIREKAFQPNHPFLAMSLDHLATDYTLLGRYAEAEPLFKRAQTIAETPAGSGGLLTANILDDYAELLRRTNRANEAGNMKARAQAIRDKQQKR